jgi:hypothetical protein
VIHQQIIQMATANTLLAAGSNANGFKNQANKAKAGPAIKAQYDLEPETEFFSTDSIWVKINHLCILPTDTKHFAERTRHIDSILFQGT